MPWNGLDEMPAKSIAGCRYAVVGEKAIILGYQALVSGCCEQIKPLAIEPTMARTLEAAKEKAPEQGGGRGQDHTKLILRLRRCSARTWRRPDLDSAQQEARLNCCGPRV
jgi:hypothetical protein